MTTFKSRIGAVVIPLLPFNRRTFGILRYELRAFVTTLANAISLARRAKISALAKAHELSINLGSGGRGLPDWVNIELTRHRDTTLCLDIRRPLPFANASARRVFAEHVVEHLEFRQDVPPLLREIHRILAPQGIVRIIVPDAERFLKAYAGNDSELWKKLGWDVTNLPGDIYTPMHAINHVFHQGGEHQFAYDFETMKFVLQQAGFQTIVRRSFKVSADPQLAIDQDNHQLYSLYVEATK
ncbi:MAG: methyltransferase domain-containing protein [Pseudolabrys sp.]